MDVVTVSSVNSGSAASSARVEERNVTMQLTAEQEQSAMTRDFMKLIARLGPYSAVRHIFLATLKERPHEDYFTRLRGLGFIYMVAPPFQSFSTKRRPRPVRKWVTLCAAHDSVLDPELEEAALHALRAEGTTTILVSSTGNRMHVKFLYERAADNWIARGRLHVHGNTFGINACREQRLVSMVESKVEEAEREGIMPPID